MRLRHRVFVSVVTTGLLAALVLALVVWVQVATAESTHTATLLPRLAQALLVGVAFAVAVAVVAGLLLARSTALPIEALNEVTSALARGESSRSPRAGSTGDFSVLEDSIRLLADQAAARQEALAAEQALLLALTESLNEGVVAVDARQQVVRINETARQFLRLKEPVPFPTDSLPRDRTMREALASVLRGEDAMPSEVRVDDRTLTLTARPLPDGGAILAMYDLTPFRRLEAVRRDFVANVSHELRTPLTVITGFVETLMDEELPLDLRRQFMGMTTANVHRMQRIVDDLLDLSRIESGGWLPNPSSLDVRLLANEIVAPLASAAAERGVALEIEIGANATSVYVDPTAARQILTNLTENALRHTTSGSVTLFASRDSEGVWLGVKDTGTGIPEEHLPRIFERFYRADPGRAREAGGTGLGLAIVRHLAESHGGRVRATSTIGAGTSISALFPLSTVAGQPPMA